MVDDLLDVLGDVPAGMDGAMATVEPRELAKAQRAAASIAKADRNRGKAVERLAESVAVLAGADGTGTDGAGPVLSSVSKVLPEKERIRICRRETDGKLTQINDYSLNEIGADGDVASFVNRRLRPSFGDFDYVVSVLGKDGQARPHSTVPRRDPRSDRPVEEGPASLVKAIVEAMRSERTPPAAPAGPSLSEKMAERMMERMAEGQKADPMAMMMIPMLREAMRPQPVERPNDALMGILSQLAERMDRMERRRDEPAPFPVLPPVAEEPRIDMAEIVRTIAASVAPKAGPEAITLRDVLDLQARMQPPPRESLGIKEIVALLPTFIPAVNALTGRDLLQRQLDDVRQELRDRRQITGETSIDEEMNKLIRARNVALQLVGGQRDGSEWKDAILHIWDTIPKHLEAARMFAKELSDKAGARSGKARGAKVPPEASKEAADEDGGVEELVVTMNAKRVLDELADAPDDKVMVKAFEFLQAAAAGNDRWKRYAGLLVALSKKGEKDRMMVVMEAILTGLVDGDLLDGGKAERVRRALLERSDDLMRALAS